MNRRASVERLDTFTEPTTWSWQAMTLTEALLDPSVTDELPPFEDELPPFWD